MRSPLAIPAFALLLAVWSAMLMLGGAGWVTDRDLLALFYAGGQPGLIHAAILLTAFGGWALLLLLTLAAVAWLLFLKRGRDALLLLGVSLGGRLLVELQKYFSGRVRPDALDQLVPVHSLSFPSGHSANSMIVYLAIALLLFPGRRAAVALAIAWSLLIGLSRLLLGVHWPSDVIGGWAFGLLWTLAILRFARTSSGGGGTPATDCSPASVSPHRD